MLTMGARVVYVPTCLCADVPKACQHFIFTCQHANKCASVPTYQRRANFQIGVSACNFKIFQLWLILANFKNIWAILENLSSETTNLNFDICMFFLTC